MGLGKRLRSAWRAFEAAQATPQHFRRPFSSQQSPDAAVQMAGTSLSEWGRYLDENHDIAIGVVDDLVTNIVGVGIRIEPRPVVGGRVNTDLADAINDAFSDWARTPEVTTEVPWPELQRLVCRAWLRDGECFVQHVSSTSPYPWAADAVRYKLEFLESAMVPMDTDRENSGARQGIFHDAWNRPTGYLVYLRNPYDYTVTLAVPATTGDLTQTKTVPAERISHIKFARRWPQTRGVPVTHGVIRRLQDLKDYEDSERIAARVAASMCAYIRKSPDNTYEIKDESFNNRPERMQSGRIFDDLLPGEEIGTISSDRPNQGLQDFRNAMLRAVAAGTGTRYSSIAKDYSGTYSSQRQELVESRAHTLRLRSYLVERFLRPVYERWLQQAWLQGAIPSIPNGTPFSDLRRAEFIGPGMPWLDPLKEVQADAMAVEKNFATREQVIISRGGDPRDVPEVEQPDPATVLSAVPNEEDEDDEDDQSDSGTA